MRYIFPFILFFILNAQFAEAVETRVEFAATAALIKIKGGEWDSKNSSLLGGVACTGGEVKAGKLSGIFLCDVRKFGTGLETRDKHMQIWLKAAKFPIAKVQLDPVAVSGNSSFSGKINLMGVVKPITGKLESDGKKGEANFTIKLHDFKPDAPWYKEQVVDNDVNITVHLDLTK